MNGIVHDSPAGTGDLYFNFSETVTDFVRIRDQNIKRYTGEFWTSKQRQASKLHEISYRACFKPQLPAFFINHLTKTGDMVYDPFSGRGTTAIEAGLLGRNVIANDINPLSRILILPRFFVPDLNLLEKRLEQIPYEKGIFADIDLSMFYHPDTESEIVSLRNYLLEREAEGQLDRLDSWIRMVATNRLTGHSSGFFSVYTMPPNQAVTPERQIMINEKRNQKPEYKDTKIRILKKSKQLLKDITPKQTKNLRTAGEKAQLFTCNAAETYPITSGSVKLTVTSPPFLNVVNYSSDNWLRCWFNGIDADKVKARVTKSATVKSWSSVMGGVFHELFRITCPGGRVAFEVGEVQKGKVRLDEHVVPLGLDAGFLCEAIIVNSQNFTKTANIWGVSNMKGGTNTNRIVMFEKPE